MDVQDTINIKTKMIQVKIKLQEYKINDSSSAEEMKMTENRIIKLQKDLFEIRKHVEQQNGKISIQSSININ